MSYRNKTYIAFASEDIRSYYLMQAWRDNNHIAFNFYDAHDINTARDTSLPETIKRRLRERMNNTKQVVLLGSPTARRKGGDGVSFLAHEVKVALELDLPIVIAHLDGSRQGPHSNIPQPLLDSGRYMLSVSFQAAIIIRALDDYAVRYADSNQAGKLVGHRIYNAAEYTALGL